MAHAMRDRHDVQAQMNITPLVDVMMVLLVIFMVTAPALATRVDSRLPQPGPEPLDPPTQVRIDIDAAGLWSIDGIPLGREAAAARLRAIVRQHPDSVAVVRAGADADYQQFLDALALARQSGLREISTPTQ